MQPGQSHPLVHGFNFDASADALSGLANMGACLLDDDELCGEEGVGRDEDEESTMPHVGGEMNMRLSDGQPSLHLPR